MKGYRTLIVNVIALLASILGMYGHEVSPEDQVNISTAILAIVNIALRFYTTTAIGEKE
jgi:preprotein translocase subunit SecY